MLVPTTKVGLCKYRLLFGVFSLKTLTKENSKWVLLHQTRLHRPVQWYLHIIYLLPRDCCSKFATELKCLNRHSSKNIWVTRFLLPKWFTHKGITLAKGKLGHSYNFWPMSILIFSSVANFRQQSMCMYFKLNIVFQ